MPVEIKVAWTVEIYPGTCIVFATTKPKARWIAVKAYREAFSNPAGWPCCSAKRAPQFDRSMLRHCYPRAYTRGAVADSATD